MIRKRLRVVSLWSACFCGLFGQNNCSKTTLFWRGRNVLSFTRILSLTKIPCIIHIHCSAGRSRYCSQCLFCPVSVRNLVRLTYHKDFERLNGNRHDSLSVYLSLLALVNQIAVYQRSVMPPYSFSSSRTYCFKNPESSLRWKILKFLMGTVRFPHHVASSAFPSTQCRRPHHFWLHCEKWKKNVTEF